MLGGGRVGFEVQARAGRADHDPVVTVAVEDGHVVLGAGAPVRERSANAIGLRSVWATDFAITRSVETGSWLGLPYQGRGGVQGGAGTLAVSGGSQNSSS